MSHPAQLEIEPARRRPVALAVEGTVSVRSRTAGDQGSSALESFLETARAAIASRSNDV